MTVRTARFSRNMLLAGTALLMLALEGCASTASPAPESVFAPPHEGDDGVVIAESAVVQGVSKGGSVTGAVDDCTGPGLGVTVEGTLSGDHYLFDKNGEPCDAAQTLFDGRNDITKRQTDPAITLNFRDNLGPLPDKDALPGLQPIPEIKLKSELLPNANAAIEPAAGPSTAQLGNKTAPAVQVASIAPAKADPLVATLASWDKQDAVYAERSSEANDAANREIGKISKDVQGAREQENVSKLMAELRERERQVEEEQRRHAETLARAQQNREITTAARAEWQQKEQELQNNLDSTKQRLAQFEDLSQHLAADKTAKEKAYQEQISNLSNDLKVAEAQADTSRRELVLQAAAKIAEAEQLGHAAQMQEQEIKLREAARLKAEAETMMDRALAIKAGNSVVVGGVGAPPAVPLALMDTPVVLHANGQTLSDILTTILGQAQPQAGQWKAEWQLTPAAQYIMKEKWSLTAEAPVQQVLSQLQQQVKAAHGLSLTFTQFGQSRLLVVTDATPLSIEDAAK